MPENLRVLRRKVRTTESIWQITRAMSMVSAVQLRRVQEGVEQRRAYFAKLSGMLAHISASSGSVLHPYLRPVGVEKCAGLVVAAGDRGLCGSYNSNLFRAVEDFLRTKTCRFEIIAVGAKAVAQARRSNWNVTDSYGSLRDIEDTEKAAQISAQIRRHFDDGSVDSLYVAYTRFLSMSRHMPVIERILPVKPSETEEDADLEYIFEPDAAELIKTVVPMAVDAELRYYLLQALASEHAARMIAMTTSSDNAEEMRDDLTKQLNRARQERITSEVLEVVTGAEALRQR